MADKCHLLPIETRAEVIELSKAPRGKSPLKISSRKLVRYNTLV